MRVRFAFGFVVITVLSAAPMSGCDINPQPEVPSDDDDGTGGEAGATGYVPGTQRADDGAEEYDDLDPSAAGFADKSSEEAGAGPGERPDAAAPPPSYAREDAGVPGVVN